MVYPTDLVKEMGELGFMGLCLLPPMAEVDTLSYVIAMEEISKIDASTSVIMSAHILVYMVLSSSDQKRLKKIFSSLSQRKSYWMFCLSEQRQEVTLLASNCH